MHSGTALISSLLHRHRQRYQQRQRRHPLYYNHNDQDTHNTTTTDDIDDKFYHNTTTTSPTGARNKTDGHADRHKDCRKEKDAHKQDAEETCDELEKAQMGVRAPLLDFELDIDMSDEETLKHLKLMDEHFCGHWKEYEDTWTGCGLHTETRAAQNDKCVDFRDDAEEALCTLKSELEATCKDFDKCWTEAIARFNERKATIKELQDLLEEYEAVSKVNCLWDAWKWLDNPFTVDEDKVKASRTSTSSATTTSSMTSTSRSSKTSSTSTTTSSPSTASSATSALTGILSHSTSIMSTTSSTIPTSPSTSSSTSVHQVRMPSSIECCSCSLCSFSDEHFGCACFLVPSVYRYARPQSPQFFFLRSCRSPVQSGPI
mmetsp:Transcript_5867/g.12861  ORF Transcript_5867/g.12861 Transcript_5867/m.12861 type:complete len:374 (+) Transcript_5867:39-1160(+)